MGHHFVPRVPAESAPGAWIGRLLQSGWCGVDLFFVLSGFLITGILADARPTIHSLKTFYLRRALRILPLYWGTLTVLLVLGPALGWYDARRVQEHQIWYWTFTANLPYVRGIEHALQVPWFCVDHFWSLAVEEQFYLLWPWVVLFSSRRRALISCGVLGVLSFALRCYHVATAPYDLAAYFYTIYRLDAFALGGALALCDRRPLLAGARLLVTLSGALLMIGFVAQQGLDYGNPWVASLGFALLALLAGCAIVLVVEDPQAWVSRLACTPVLGLTGRHSYALYIVHYVLYPTFLTLWHPRVLEGWLGPLGALLGFEVLSMAASLGLALAIDLLFERHVRAFKQRFTQPQPA